MFYFDELHGNMILRSFELEEITAFFTTRSSDENRLFEGLQPKRIIKPEQTHSANVEIVDDRLEYPNTDGLILTNTEDLICLKFADCTPLIFYDSKNKIAAISHAGWRGTAQKIGVKTVEIMQQKFQSKPQDITVLIGPAISLCCYEVSDEVKETLLKTVNDTSNLSDGKKVDLKGINARQLQEIGVEKIDICPYCTSCRNDRFYSYRKENGTTNRHKAIVMLNPKLNVY